MSFTSLRAVIFDLDGTIYCGDHPMAGAQELLQFLSERGTLVFFGTNNSTRTRQQISAKLNGMALPATPERVYSAAYLAARYLRENRCREVYCFGSQGLAEELKLQGVATVATPEDATVLLIGLDTGLDYQRISTLLPLRDKPCRLVACNRDKFFPSDQGKPQLGCGFVVRVVEEALGRSVDYVVGKPNPYLLDLVLSEHGLAKDEVLVIGDSRESDVGMAQAAGCRFLHLSTEKGAGLSHVNSLTEVRSILS